MKELRQEEFKKKSQLEELEQENRRLRERLAELEEKLARPRPVELPLGEKPPSQQYGAGLIAFCVNLARRIGFRPTVAALRVLATWLDVKIDIPSYQTIRTWVQRIGLDRMQNAKKSPGGVWLTDHTNQIGKEKVLVVLRVPDAKLKRETPLRLAELDVLTVLPGEEWKEANVASVYEETAKRCGIPRAVETDGACELQEPINRLGTPEKRPLLIRDPKHFLANKFEALLTRDSQYESFTKKLGGTRSALQQTELAHFIPPVLKTKARFMNLAPMLNWASTVLWHLEHPESQSRQNISDARMMEKLGWVRHFALSIQEWQACQKVVSITLKFINAEGIFHGAAEQLKQLLAPWEHYPTSRKLAEMAIEFLNSHEGKLQPGEHLPMSTEIVESSFARYKHLEKQHSKSGFTSLILAYPTLLRRTTPEEVTESFARVKVTDVHQWIKDHLPNTLASKRQRFYRESRPPRKQRTRATPVNNAA